VRIVEDRPKELIMQGTQLWSVELRLHHLVELGSKAPPVDKAREDHRVFAEITDRRLEPSTQLFDVVASLVE
jgi:hypothetical protein